jgi:protein required for attachment to host cells
MDKIAVRAGDWVIVCDGRKALILENIGDARYPNLHLKEVRDEPAARTSNQGTDAPGKTHPSVGTARSAVEQTDWHDLSECAFLTALASRLHLAITKRETRGFIVVAAPRALGMIRTAYSPAVRKAVRTELAKDLVKEPIYQIEKELFPPTAGASAR